MFGLIKNEIALGNDVNTPFDAVEKFNFDQYFYSELNYLNQLQGGFKSPHLLFSFNIEHAIEATWVKATSLSKSNELYIIIDHIQKCAFPHVLQLNSSQLGQEYFRLGLYEIRSNPRLLYLQSDRFIFSLVKLFSQISKKAAEDFKVLENKRPKINDA